MSVTRVLVVEGLVNLVLVAVKLFVGLITQSSVILADALHSFTDFANNIVAFIAAKIANEPPDKRHPYGHQKFEYLAIFLLAVLLAVVAIELVLYAIEHHGRPVEQSHVGLVLLIGATFCNLLLSFWERKKAKELQSALLAADADHTLSDVLTSVAVVIGWQLAAMGYFWLDTLFCLLVAAVVARLSWKLFKQALPVLVDEQLSESDFSTEKVKALAVPITGIEEVCDIRARALGSTRVAADLTIRVDANQTLQQAHELAHEFEEILKIQAQLDDVVIHIEPSKRNPTL